MMEHNSKLVIKQGTICVSSAGVLLIIISDKRVPIQDRNNETVAYMWRAVALLSGRTLFEQAPKPVAANFYEYVKNTAGHTAMAVAKREMRDYRKDPAAYLAEGNEDA